MKHPKKGNMQKSKVIKHNNGSGDVNSKNFRNVKMPRFDFTLNFQDGGFYQYLFIAFLACVVSYLHWWHISYIFENQSHFSYLSNLEREMFFRTEMGLYYSYFKTIVNSPDGLASGLNEIIKDNHTEYPDTINTLQRFNLWPEVVLSMAYKFYINVQNWRNVNTISCYNTFRGKDLPDITSCEGNGDPTIFYTNAIWIINGILMGIFFLFGSILSGGCWLGGLITTAGIFFNHGDCTRVMNSPPLRENFAYPFCVLQALVVTLILKSEKPNRWHSIALAITTVSYVLPWQFAQFSLLTQIIAVFLVYCIRYSNHFNMCTYLYGIWLGFLISFVCLFANSMLITSFFFSALISVTLIVNMEPLLKKLHFFILELFVKGISVIIGTVGFKILFSKLLNIQDDAHISDILRSKFTDFKNFHTRLYTCAAEFDFLPMETVYDLCKSGLIPVTIICIGAVVFQVLLQEYLRWRYVSLLIEKRCGGEVFYNILQLCAYALMAGIIMRLKLFFTPHLCIVSSLIASKKYFWFNNNQFLRYSLVVFIMSIMAYKGTNNMKIEWSRTGEFSDLDTEQLFNWVDTTKPNAVFAGPMPTMANLKLSTNRPIVIHPHYEDVGLRSRVKRVYMMFSRRDEKDVYNVLRDMYVEYLVIAHMWCTSKYKSGCAMVDSWDDEDIELRNNKIFCKRFIIADQNKITSKYFEKVFENSAYTVIRLRNAKKYNK